jgi:hydroxylaminobenzene mutase
MLSRQGHRLLQLGVALFLLTSLEGFVIPGFAAPRLGLSAHSLMALLGVLLIAVGLLWSRLHLGIGASRFAFWLLIYSSLAIVAAYLLGAIWGAGSSTMPLAAGAAHGSDFQEAIIKIVAYSSAPTGMVSFALILWGLRIDNTQSRNG